VSIDWVNAGIIAGGFTGVGAGLLSAVARHQTRATREIATHAIRDAMRPVIERLDRLQERAETDRLHMAREFGGNSNGLRQTVNAIRDDLTEAREDIAATRAAFEQHMKESSR
jgi:gas vesicle protein